MSAFDSYIICTTPRSGSTLLCQLLSDSCVAGHPESYFHRPDVSAWTKSLNVSPKQGEARRDFLRRVLSAAIERGTQNTGLFGLRLQRGSFDYLAEQLGILSPLATTDLARLESAFGRILFIHLTRADKVAQAISLVKAQQTGLWHAAPDGTEIERLSPPMEPVYDPQAIQGAVAELTSLDREWDDWFTTEGIKPLVVKYDVFADSPLEVLQSILVALGADVKAAKVSDIGVARLSDDINRDWVERFRNDPANGADTPIP